MTANYEGFNPSEPESYIALSMYQSNHLSNSLLIASKIQNQFKHVLTERIGELNKQDLWLLVVQLCPVF